MYYFLTVIVTAIIIYLIKDFDFKCFIEDRSKRAVGSEFWGKTYFFMTQDQIQNACKSIIKSFPEDFKKKDIPDYNRFQTLIDRVQLFEGRDLTYQEFNIIRTAFDINENTA